MRKEELIKIKKLINEEIFRRKTINELLSLESTKKLLDLTGLKIDFLDYDNIREIIGNIIKDYNICETNNIYVCTRAYYLVDYGNHDRDNYSYSTNINDNECAEYKSYRDIESGKYIKAVKERVNRIEKRPLIEVFEKNNIVLNPYNESSRKHVENGYEEVILEFFYEAYKNGQNKALKKILTKYPRLGGN